MGIAPFPRGDLRWRGDERKILGLDLGFGEKEEEDYRFWREEDEDGEGRLMNGVFNQKEMNPWDVGRKLQVCHWVNPRGSTHDSQNFRKIMNKF